MSPKLIIELNARLVESEEGISEIREAAVDLDHQIGSKSSPHLLYLFEKSSVQ